MNLRVRPPAAPPSPSPCDLSAFHYSFACRQNCFIMKKYISTLPGAHLLYNPSALWERDVVRERHQRLFTTQRNALKIALILLNLHMERCWRSSGPVEMVPHLKLHWKLSRKRVFEPRRPHSVTPVCSFNTSHRNMLFPRGKKEMCWLSWKSIAIFISFSVLNGSKSRGRVAGMRCGQGDMGRWQRAAAGIDLRSVTPAHSWKSALKCFSTHFLFFIFCCYSLTPTLHRPGRELDCVKP